MRNLISGFLILLSFAAVSSAGEETKPYYDWQLEDSYNPPNFEKYFPDDREAGKELDKLLLALRDELTKIRAIKAEQSDLSQALSMINDLTLIKNGFRNASERRSFLIQLMSKKYVSKPPHNPEALEMLYHAADPENKYGTRHDAIYYCLQRLRPVKPPAVLRAFIDIAMTGNMTGNELGEIRGGCEGTGQLDEIRVCLTPYLKQKGTKACQIAMLLDTYFGVPSDENSIYLPGKTAQEIRKVKYAAEETKPAYDWQLEDSYNPPDFEKYFPDDKEAGKELDKLVLALNEELDKIKQRRTQNSDWSRAFL
jgi:hypothetical protein